MSNRYSLLTAEEARQEVKMINGNIVNSEYYFYSSMNDFHRKGLSEGKYDYQKGINGKAINFDNVSEDIRILARLAEVFPEEENCKNYYPFGYFKDEVYNNPEIKSRQDIYNFLKEKFTRIRTTSNGKRASFLDIAVSAAKKQQSLWYGYDKYSTEQILIGCSLWIWHTTRGMLAEEPTIELLNKYFDKRFEGMKVIPATGAHEKYDIDAIVIDEATGVDIVYVSIKTGTTLSVNSIENTWRKPKKENGKGKDKPMLYAGFDKYNKFKIITPEDWKGLLRERITNRIEAPTL